MRVIIVSVLVTIIFLYPVTGAYTEETMEEKFVRLPEPILKGRISLEECIKKRRSIRNFLHKEPSLEQISQLLWSAQGITDTIKGFRAAPSAGALYPLELYIAKKDGLFHYLPQGHKLELVTARDIRRLLSDACWGQDFVAQAPVVIIICAVYERVTLRYGKRGIRYTDIEVGHTAENIHLQAVALGLDSVPVGAFSDNEVSSVLGLREKEVPVYIIPVGYKK